jgi:hypothetical protein
MTDETKQGTCDVEGCNARAIAELHRSGERCEKCLLFDLDARKT